MSNPYIEEEVLTLIRNTFGCDPGEIVAEMQSQLAYFEDGVRKGFAAGMNAARPPVTYIEEISGVPSDPLPLYWEPEAWMSWHSDRGIPVPELDEMTRVWTRSDYSDGWHSYTLGAFLADQKTGCSGLQCVLDIPGQVPPVGNIMIGQSDGLHQLF